MKLLPLFAGATLIIATAGCASSDKNTTTSTTTSTTDMPVAATTPSTSTTTTTTTDTPATPTSTPSTATTSISTTTTASSDNLVDYTVASGDSLWKIAHAHHITVGKLKRINNLTTDNLSIGQVLKVPQS